MKRVSIIIALIITSLILIGCGTSKGHCDAYGSVEVEVESTDSLG